MNRKRHAQRAGVARWVSVLALGFVAGAATVMLADPIKSESSSAAAPQHDHAVPVAASGQTNATGAQSQHTHGSESEISYANLPATTKDGVDQVIAAWAHRYPTAADATANGWVKASLSFYGIGAHYTHGVGVPATPTFDLLNPNMLLYDGEGPDAKFAGVSYSTNSATAPEGFKGSYDVWHSHPTACFKGGSVVSLTEDNSKVWLSESDCLARGGRVQAIPGDLMLHVWIGTGYREAPIFAHDNPELYDGFQPQRDA
jgi:hypothetical protein